MKKKKQVIEITDWYPEAWRFNPEKLTDDVITMWSGGNSLTISLEKAKRLVADKDCFILTPYMISVNTYKRKK